MCYTLNNGWCLRSGQAAASQAPVREGGSTAGFISAVQAEKNRGGRKAFQERWSQNIQTQSKRKMYLCYQLLGCLLRKPEPSLLREATGTAWLELHLEMHEAFSTPTETSRQYLNYLSPDSASLYHPALGSCVPPWKGTNW